MLKELLKSELTQLSVEITDMEDQLAEVMASGCGKAVNCGGTSGSGGGNCNID